MSWYACNDEQVKKVTQKTVLEDGHGYLFFYSRRADQPRREIFRVVRSSEQPALQPASSSLRSSSRVLRPEETSSDDEPVIFSQLSESQREGEKTPPSKSLSQVSDSSESTNLREKKKKGPSGPRICPDLAGLENATKRQCKGCSTANALVWVSKSSWSTHCAKHHSDAEPKPKELKKHAPPDPSPVPKTAASGRGESAGSSASSRGESSDDRSNAGSQGRKKKRRRRKSATETADTPKAAFSSDYAISLEEQSFLDELDVDELRRLYIPTLKKIPRKFLKPWNALLCSFMQTFCVLFKPLTQEQSDVDHADTEVLRTRAIKLFYLLPQMLFFAPMRTFGSEIRFEQMQNANEALKKRFILAQLGSFSELFHSARDEFELFTAERGLRTSTKPDDPDAFLADRFCNLAQTNQFSRANKLLHSFGIATENVEEEIKTVIVEDKDSSDSPRPFSPMDTQMPASFLNLTPKNA